MLISKPLGKKEFDFTALTMDIMAMNSIIEEKRRNGEKDNGNPYENLDLEKIIKGWEDEVERNRSTTACASCHHNGKCRRLKWDRNLDMVRVIGCSEHQDQVRFLGHSTTVELSLSYCDSLRISNATWATAYNAASSTSGGTGAIKTELLAGTYYLDRYMCICPTDSLSDIAVVSAAELHWYITSIVNGDATDNKVYLMSQTGIPTVPANTPVNANFDRTLYTVDRGNAIMTAVAWNTISITTPGTLINLFANTRFIARHTKDYNNSAPAGKDDILPTTHTGANKPHLNITFDVAAFVHRLPWKLMISGT